MATKLQTISAHELASKIGSSVQAALKKAKIPEPQQPQIIINWHILGFILREGEVRDVGQLEGLANEVAKSAGGLQEFAAAAGPGQARPGVVAFLPNKQIICGFLPGPLPIAFN